MQKIEAIIRPEKLGSVKEALSANGICGLNITRITGRGVQKGIVGTGRGEESYEIDLLPKVKLEIVVSDAATEAAIGAICRAAYTGNIGDGKIFLSPVTDAVRIRTHERGDAALQGEPRAEGVASGGRD
ncbi:MAG TPA: P-II family nitrogen regulator [Dehalococcoidia bacterium]|nr:P-II family nitrogen regulator [Dehalococcoidia bacterium]